MEIIDELEPRIRRNAWCAGLAICTFAATWTPALLSCTLTTINLTIYCSCAGGGIVAT